MELDFQSLMLEKLTELPKGQHYNFYLKCLKHYCLNAMRTENRQKKRVICIADLERIKAEAVENEIWGTGETEQEYQY